MGGVFLGAISGEDFYGVDFSVGADFSVGGSYPRTGTFYWKWGGGVFRVGVILEGTFPSSILYTSRNVIGYRTFTCGELGALPTPLGPSIGKYPHLGVLNYSYRAIIFPLSRPSSVRALS